MNKKINLCLNCNLDNTNWENIRIGIKKYLLLMQLLKTKDIQTANLFHRTFNGFYKVRRQKDFRDALFGYLEYNKNKKVSFKQSLLFFNKKFQRLEPSFSSKIVATINPNLPIWDTEVLARLNITVPNYNLDREIRSRRMTRIYEKIVGWYSKFLNTKQAETMIETFNKKIGILDITPIKKIDFILWQTRK